MGAAYQRVRRLAGGLMATLIHVLPRCSMPGDDPDDEQVGLIAASNFDGEHEHEARRLTPAETRYLCLHRARPPPPPLPVSALDDYLGCPSPPRATRHIHPQSKIRPNGATTDARVPVDRVRSSSFWRGRTQE
jgi:hypothetical protein